MKKWGLGIYSNASVCLVVVVVAVMCMMILCITFTLLFGVDGFLDITVLCLCKFSRRVLVLKTARNFFWVIST